MGGRPKALLELGGRRIIDRVAHVMRQVADDLLIVTNTPELYAGLGLPMVPDAFPDHGSLGGIYSGLQAASGDAAFTVACDMPFLMPEVARLVTDGQLPSRRISIIRASPSNGVWGPVDGWPDSMAVFATPIFDGAVRCACCRDRWPPAWSVGPHPPSVLNSPVRWRPR